MKTLAIYAIIIKENKQKKVNQNEVQIIIFWRNSYKPQKAGATYIRYSYAVPPPVKEITGTHTVE